MNTDLNELAAIADLLLQAENNIGAETGGKGGKNKANNGENKVTGLERAAQNAPEHAAVHDKVTQDIINPLDILATI